MSEFGLYTGIAFQIKDDLFDYGDSDIGKPTGIDIKEKKMTLPLIHALQGADKSTKKSIIRIIKSDNKDIAEILGVARGSTVRARNIGRDIFAGLKNIVGGEINEYTKLQAESREQAIQRMTQDAQRLGADAIVNVRLTTAMIMQGTAEILAYGTAVKFK
jgi:uncharacterized protein YbjQ (UPF0145 family)